MRGWWCQELTDVVFVDVFVDGAVVEHPMEPRVEEVICGAARGSDQIKNPAVASVEQAAAAGHRCCSWRWRWRPHR